MRFLVGNCRQQLPVNLLGVLLKQRLQVRQHAVHRAQEGAGVNVIKIVPVTEIFLFQTRQGAVFIDGIKEIEHGRRDGLIVVQLGKPGHRLFVGHIQRHGDFRMNALEKTDRHRISNGIGQLFIFYLLQQFGRAEFRIDRPAEVRVFFLFQRPQIVNHHMAWRNGQLLVGDVGQ